MYIDVLFCILQTRAIPSEFRVDGSENNVLPGIFDSVRTEPFNGFLLFHLQCPNWYLAWATRIR